MPTSALTATAWVGAVLTVLGALWKAITTIWKMAHRVQQMWELIERELTPNGGTSIRDKVDCINIRLDELERIRLDDLALTRSYRAAVLHRLHILDGGPGDCTDVVGAPV